MDRPQPRTARIALGEDVRLNLVEDQGRMTVTTFLLLAPSVLAASLAGLLAPANDEAKAAPEFRKGIRAPENINFVSKISGDRQAATLIFDNLLVSVDPVRKGSRGPLDRTAQQTKLFSVEVPYATEQRSVEMAMDLRGFVSADSQARVRLVAFAGDSATVIDLSDALRAESDRAAQSQEKPRSGSAVKLKGKTKKAILASRDKPHQEASGDFQERVVFTVQTQASEPVCRVTLLLLAEQSTDVPDAGGALLAVDSIDLSFAKSGKGKYK